MEAQATMVDPSVVWGIHNHHHCHLPLHGTLSSMTTHGMVDAVYIMVSRDISLP
jgi:hypothetical protein